MPMPPHLISITPNPARPASWVLVCYDFSHGATSPVTLSITLYTKPVATETSLTLTADEPCAPLYIPPGCTGALAVDDTGQSADEALTVTP